jgi:hypothetical protein
MAKMDDRRLVPICDRLFDILQPLRRDSGPVISLKKPEDETARLRQVTGIPWRRNALRAPFILQLPGCDHLEHPTGEHRKRELSRNDQEQLLGPQTPR